MKRSSFETICDGATLRGELFLPESADRVTVVPLCHGIPREKPREGDAGYLPLARQLTEEGFGSLIFNFRGCGISEGNFDMAGWGRDLETVVKSLCAMSFVERVVPWGFSGGAAAAVWAGAHTEKIAAVALFACPAEFTTIRAVPAGSALVEYFRTVGIVRDPDFPPDADEWLAGFERINPVQHIPMISPRPVLIVHGTADETVPVEHARKLMQAAREPKTLEILENAPHRLRVWPQALETALSWLKNLQ